MAFYTTLHLLVTRREERSQMRTTTTPNVLLYWKNDKNNELTIRILAARGMKWNVVNL